MEGRFQLLSDVRRKIDVLSFQNQTFPGTCNLNLHKAGSNSRAHGPFIWPIVNVWWCYGCSGAFCDGKEHLARRHSIRAIRALPRVMPFDGTSWTWKHQINNAAVAVTHYFDIGSRISACRIYRKWLHRLHYKTHLHPR